MRPYFTRERFGRAQFLAGALLLAFLAQAVWLVNAELSTGNLPDINEAVRVGEGWKQWHGRGIAGAPMQKATDQNASDEILLHNFGVEDGAFDAEHSPLLYLGSAAPLLAWPRGMNRDSVAHWRWLTRLPFLACGLFLGASLWYVARRLCGNTGGFIALTFYAFSPLMLQAGAVWHTEPEIAAAWGAFGAIFTAIAVAHTLYAPREVVLWNWRRIVLLGIALAIAIGSQFSMIVLLPITLGFLLYVAPVRQRAGLVIWLAACAVGFILLFASYFFRLHAFAESMSHAVFWGVTWRGFAIPGVYKQVALQIGRASPVLALALPVAVITYATWQRTRYFGNTAPLLVALVFLALGMAHPDSAGAGFLLAAVPFLFIFVAGVLADLLETRYRLVVSACIIGMMAAYVVWNLISLAHIPRG
jgi:hypothetical protein